MTAADLRAGTEMRWTRSFSEAEVHGFAELSGDRGRHHLQHDEKGRLMVHGLLTASLPTKLGGDLHYIARTMHFVFLRPVYAGEVLDCRGLVEEVEPEPKRFRVAFSFTIINPAGKPVLKGSSSGVIYR
jgi:3-hydroxybutyryl-CoA dehydratase